MNMSNTITGLLGIPAILLLLLSSLAILSKKKGKEGSAELLIGALLMGITVLGKYYLYYQFTNSQYQFEKNQENYFSISDFLSNLYPVGLLLFSIGLARISKLLTFIREWKTNV